MSTATATPKKPDTYYKAKINKTWDIDVRPGMRAGWLCNQWSCTSFIVYDDGRIAYDNPAMVPPYIRGRIKSYCRMAARYWKLPMPDCIAE